MKKGVELPINVLVIVSVAVIVLLGIIALFMSIFSPSGPTLQIQTAWSRGCSKITGNCFAYAGANSLDFASNLNVTMSDIDEQSYGGKFLGLCKYMGYTSEDLTDTTAGGGKQKAVVDCIKACGCNSY